MGWWYSEFTDLHCPEKINGQWIQEVNSKATHSSINMGSSLNGECQIARGFEGMEDKNDPTPCINITKRTLIHMLHLYLAVTDLVIQFIGVK